MDPKDSIRLIQSIMEQTKAGYWAGYDYEDSDHPGVTYGESGDITLNKEEAADFDKYCEDVAKFRAQTRLLAQRKKEVISIKKKLANRLKKADQLLVNLKELVEKYGHLENSADLLAAALMEFSDEED
jgi:hypothetical protein